MVTAGAPCDLSVIVPVYNAAATLERVAGEVLALQADGLRCQVIFVDDASGDGSAGVADALADRHPEVLVLRHARDQLATSGRAPRLGGGARAAGRARMSSRGGYRGRADAAARGGAADQSTA